MNDPKPAQNRTESDERPESGLPAVQGAREARYAEAIRGVLDDFDTVMNVRAETREVARRVMSVADAEVAAAVRDELVKASPAITRIAMLREERDTARRLVTLDASSLKREMRRAESAETEVERLRDGITSLLPAECWVSRSERVRCIDFVGGTLGSGTFSLDMVCLPCRLRALLAPSPAATTGEDDEPLPDYLKELQRPTPASSGEAATGEVCPDCDHFHTPEGCTGPSSPSDQWAGVSVEGCDCDFDQAPPPLTCPVTGGPLHQSFDHGALVCTSCGSLAHTHPAPVSSGEAATGEAECNCGYGGFHEDQNPRCEKAVADGTARPAPVVTPSAEGDE